MGYREEATADVKREDANTGQCRDLAPGHLGADATEVSRRKGTPESVNGAERGQPQGDGTGTLR
jgi:hypothetical protein